MASLSSTLERRAAAAGLLLAGVLAVTGILATWAETSDDAFVTFRYSLFLARGEAPYYNPGEPVEGYTNFLLMLIVAGAIAVAGPGVALVTAKVVGALAALGSVAVSSLLARGVAREAGEPAPVADVAGALAALLLALDAPFLFNATRGLETSLFGFLLALGVFLALDGLRAGRWRGSGVAFGLACLTRPEGVAVFGVFWMLAAAVHVRRGPAGRLALRVLALDALVAGAAVVGLVTFRWLTYGEWLPNTYYAKLGGAGAATPLEYVWTALSGPFLGGIVLLAGFVGMALRPRLRLAAAPLALGALVASCLPLLSGSDWMPGSRLIAPYYPLLTASVALGWATWLARMARPAAHAILVALLAATWVSQRDERENFAEWTRVFEQAWEQCIVPFARWIGEASRPGDTVAMTDIGAIGYLNPQLRILDVTGLVDRHIARSAGGFLNKEYDLDYVFGRAPRFVVLVLAAPRVSTPPPPNTRFVLYHPIERRIFQHPEFARDYVHVREPPAGGSWLDTLAAQVGAAATFEFPAIEHYYVYAVFERKT